MVNNGNLMSDITARTKWCPFSRSNIGLSAGLNRDGGGKPMEAAKCIGSTCMAWRWDFSVKESVGSCGLAGAVGTPVNDVEDKVKR
jgi:hypothetical protein